MNEQGKMNLKQVIQRTTLTLGDIASGIAALYDQDKSLLDGKILISYDMTNGNLDCTVWKSDTEVYSLFSNDPSDKRQKDFQVIVRFPISNEDKKVVEKIMKDMKITFELNEDEFQRLIEDENRIGNHRLKDLPGTLTWMRDITTTVPDHYPCYVDFPSKYPCEVTSPWDRFDSFRP